tara:strand:+ start:47 stop:295 length:249 start_codon:yes stop_codon:yes gene_type:complete
MEEQWRSIFFGNYEVSDRGRVRSTSYLRFQGKDLIKVSGKVLEPFEAKGTMRVTINSMPYSYRDFKVDYLTSLAFSELELTN